MQEDNHIFQGLRRDNHQIRQDAKFLWDAHNIRLTNRDDNTLLSITNEKGTSAPLITFEKLYVGHCVLGKYLIVFTASEDDGESYIYRVEKVGDSYKTIILYYGYLMLSPQHPIEAIGVYETELVQKVYWVDGINQPRVINIAKPELKLPTYISVGSSKKLLLADGVNLSGPNYSQDSDINQYLYYNLPNGLYQDSSFDFVRVLQLSEQVDVIKSYGQGEFSPGTIQYAFSYYNKYEQESNICYVTPLYYVSPKDRGGNPEDKVSCSFNIQVWGADMSFDYIRIYSIHRTSIDAIPTVKLVADVPTYRKDLKDAVVYCDTGDVGRTIDPTQLLYIGGKAIIPNTITHKDNTLFLGNYELQSGRDTKDIKEIIGDWELDDYQIPTNHGPVITNDVYYSYEPGLSYSNSAGFKCGEVYRYGIQVQYENGEWSEPIFLGDNELCTMFPWETYPYRDSKAITILGDNIGRDLRKRGVRKIRTCVVFPLASKTDVICQGVICPTLRKANSEWDFNSSWFFRPSVLFTGNNNTDVYHGAVIASTHNTSLRTGADRGAEIQGMTPSYLNNNTSSGGGNGYLVDENVVTFHSPDVEFNSSLASLDLSNTKLVIVGMAKLGAIYGDIDIQTSTPGINSRGASGPISPTIGYTTGRNLPVNGGLVSGLFYYDDQVKKNSDGNYSSGDPLKYWLVYPWHRSGSLNNDEVRGAEKGARTAVLLKKKLSNLKFFDENLSLGSAPIYYDVSTPQLFSSNEVSLIKLHPVYLGKDVTYLGNVDTMIINEGYNIFQGNSFDDTIVDTGGNDVITKSSEPVRIKYKSSPHLVFSLGNDKTSIEILPRHKSLGSAQDETFIPPVWMKTEESTDKGTYDGILYLYTSDILSETRNGTIYYASADSSLLGKYAIGKWRNSSGNTGYDLYQCRRISRGVKWSPANIPSDGIVMKAENTIISPSTHYIPGTTISDYSTFGSSTKLIDTKYFKITASEHEGGLTITDVTEEHNGNQVSGQSSYRLKRKVFGEDNSNPLGGSPYLLIGELIRTNVQNKFGEDGETGTENIWVPAGNPVSVYDNATSITVPFEYGDTWYSRYDCLKTYPFTQEDENQVIEIGSFMCETRVNIDGRYDRNRGQLSNLNMTPQNFNLINEVYTQKDNFFNYRIFDEDYYKQNIFANQVTWSKEKSAGEEIDTWTNITLANTLDMDGEKGKVTALRAWNEYLLCFQEKALSQILFNSRVQIPTTDGVPIEISNGYKVDGSRLLSSNIGCNDKWSITTTPSGVYFLDFNTDDIFTFNGKLINLSEANGMSWWVRQNHTDKVWCPIDYGARLNGIRTFYDNKYGDIYFTPGPIFYSMDQPDALCYSEQLGQFTSLMSYGGTQAMFNFADGFYSLRHDSNGNLSLYQNNVGDYNNFYGTIKGWDFSFISNQNPTLTKIFDTIDLRTDHYWTYNTEQLLNSCPINYIEVSNEYQHSGSVPLTNNNIRKKFRVWRGLLPRNRGTRCRIRNPWAMITLGYKPLGTTEPGVNTKKAIVHDVTVKYTV